MESRIKSAFKNKRFEIIKVPKKARDSYIEAAKATLAKDKSITIRMNSNDLAALKTIAIQSGKKYQTYIGELLHEHVIKRKKAA